MILTGKHYLAFPLDLSRAIPARTIWISCFLKERDFSHLKEKLYIEITTGWRGVCTLLNVVGEKKIYMSLTRVLWHTSWMYMHKSKGQGHELTRNRTATQCGTALQQAETIAGCLLKQHLNLGKQRPYLNKKQFVSFAIHHLGKSMTLTFQAIPDKAVSLTESDFLSFLTTPHGKRAYN